MKQCRSFFAHYLVASHHEYRPMKVEPMDDVELESALAMLWGRHRTNISWNGFRFSS